MNAKGVLAGICLFLSHAVFSMNAELAHQLIIEQSPELLGEGDQLVSVYYFGQSESMPGDSTLRIRLRYPKNALKSL